MALKDLSILIKGAGEMASGIAWRLYRSGFHNIVLLETDSPLAVRRNVCFCEAVHDGRKLVHGVEAVLAGNGQEMDEALAAGRLPVVVDPDWRTLRLRRPRVVIDAILAKRNLGTTMADGELVIGMGPGFTAGREVHVVVETNRGPGLGRLIHDGQAEKNTGIPGKVMGFDVERVIRAPRSGIFRARVGLSDPVESGDIIGEVDGEPVESLIRGRIRGIIRDNTEVRQRLKIGDIEPRETADITMISDKALAMGGAVLEAVLARYNR